MLPSGPVVMAFGLLAAAGIGNSVMRPSRAIRPMLYVDDSSFDTSMMKYRLLPSGPTVIADGWLHGVLMSKYVIASFVFAGMRPIWPVENDVNQIALSRLAT